MDKLAVKRNLMVEYSLFEATSTGTEDWNVVVAVGYPTDKGYEAVAEEFEKIRKNHKKVLIKDKDFKDLGKVVSSRKLYPRGSSDPK